MTVSTVTPNSSSTGDLPKSTPSEPPRRERAPAPIWLRTVLSIVLSLGGLFLAGNVFSSLANMKVEPPREEPVPTVFRVETFAVERAPLQRFISGYGTAQADREVTVSAEVSGRVTDNGNMKVGKRLQGAHITFSESGKSQQQSGDIIVQIDPQTYQERVTQIETLLEQDAVDLQQLEQQHETNLRLLEQQRIRRETLRGEVERFRRLLANGAGRETDLQRAELEFQQYQEGVIKTENEVSLFPARKLQWQAKKTGHESDLALAKLELQKATVRAPFSGVLSEVNVEEGQYVRPGDRLVTITNLERVEVPVPVPLDDASILSEMLAAGKFPVAELSTDEEALIRGDEAHVWHGEVRRLAPVANQQTRTTMAYVEVDNSQQTSELRPGTFVQARIEANRILPGEGVVIPRDAIVNGNVFVVEEAGDKAGTVDSQRPVQMARMRPVNVLKTLQTFVLVSDLSENDEVVMTNLDIVTDGALLDVRKQNRIQDEFERLRVPYLKQLPAAPAGQLPAEE